MRLGCPNCGALYEVAEAAIPASGREVQCSACEHRWFHRLPIENAPPDEPETESPPPEVGRPRPTDPAVLQILREEAQREMAVRRREATGTPDAAPPPPAGAEPAHPRRALLPDIDEVSPTLTPAGSSEGAGTIVVHARETPSRSGFMAGFVLTLTLAALAAAAYLWSAELAEAIPALAEPIAAYVEAVDRMLTAIRSALG